MNDNEWTETPEPFWTRVIENLAMTGLMTLWWFDIMVLGAVMNLPFFLWRLIRRRSFKSQVYEFLESYRRIDRDGIEVRPVITHYEESGYPFYQMSISADLLGPDETRNSMREIKVPYGTMWRGRQSISYNFQSNRTWAWNKREFEEFLAPFDRPDDHDRFFQDFDVEEKIQDELGK